LGGEVGAGAEGGYKEYYEDIPHGLLKRIVPRGHGPDFSSWLKSSKGAWEDVHSALSTLPPQDKYNEETWEWTVGKDYWDHRALSAAYKLEMVTDPKKCGSVCESKEKELQLLIQCANDLEESMDEDPVGPSPNVVKNAGIAYSKMVQGQFPKEIKDQLQGPGYPFLPSTRKKLFEQGYTGDWSEHASYRTLNLWRRFVDMDGSKRDPSYESVKRIVEYLEATDKGTIKPSEAAKQATDSHARAELGKQDKVESKKKKKKKKKRKKRKLKKRL
jgi:hypothetical protein